jgi:hypothetical protein
VSVFFIEKENPVISRDEQSAAFTRDYGADPLPDIPKALTPVGGVQAMDSVAFDIDEIQCFMPPDRTFSPLAAGSSDR